ncbi:unnamed protein product [Rotaria sp. Silwood2]|nr:unnamed protein product [Rotaria sp. Silwood2]CAF4251994.1 unnamed protein product [Rotaria sp. Silwood2]
MLVIENFIFKLNKATSSTKYYRCNDPCCSVVVHTDLEDNLLKIKDDHCHPPEPEEVQIRTFRQAVKTRAINETTPIPQIYDEEALRIDLSQLSIAALPSQREMSSTLNKARRFQTPPIPDTQLFDLPECYTKTIKGLSFLCIDQLVKRKTRMLVFASNEQLKMLFNSSVVLMDGTFSSSPSIFSQVYCIHSIKYEQSFVCVFALLPDQKKTTYKFLLNGLRDKAAEMNMMFNPTTIMSDFEGSLLEVLKSEFPNSQHRGCYFHHNQAIYRNIQKLGLSSAYVDDDQIRIICRKLMALALLPLSLVIEAFDNLYDSVLESSSTTFKLLEPLFKYFENQWIKTVEIKRWNAYGIQMRTNNNCEGYHNRLNSRVCKYHPNIWTFIRCIQGEENRFNHLLIQMKGGLAARPQTKTTQAIQKRIDNLYARYENKEVSPDELLEGLSFVVAKNSKSKKNKQLLISM